MILRIKRVSRECAMQLLSEVNQLQLFRKDDYKKKQVRLTDLVLRIKKSTDFICDGSLIHL